MFNLHKETIYQLYDWSKLRYEDNELTNLIAAIQLAVNNSKLTKQECFQLYQNRYTPYPKPERNAEITPIDFQAIAADENITHKYLCDIYAQFAAFI